MVGKTCGAGKSQMTLKTAIIIPARYGSTRFPGKPLAQLAGKTVLERVISVAREAARHQATVFVTTDDERIAAEAARLDVTCLMTSPECATGSDRVLAAVAQLEDQPDFVINLQGDAPLTPPDFLSAMIAAFPVSQADVITPATQLSWTELDALRASKQVTPFSGTTVVMAPDNRALWFSKNILPAIRKEKDLRAASPLSPVWRHIGVYGYRLPALKAFADLKPSHYEELEGLEQLRFLEQGLTIQCVPVDYKGRPAMTGIDSPEDLAAAERLLAS